MDDEMNPQSSSFNTHGNRTGVRTYGKSRTIVAQDFDSLLNDSYSPLQTSLDVEVDLESKKRGVKSINELRQQGKNKRFNDEIEYLLDGLQSDQPLNVRRSSGNILAQKLTKSEFLMKTRAHHFIPRVYDVLVFQDDPVIRCCFAFILCLLVEDKHNAEFFAEKTEFIRLIVDFMTCSPDPLSEDLTSHRKAEKTLIANIKTTILQSGLITDKTKISLRSIALRSLSSLISYKTRYENLIKKRLRTCGGLSTVVDILKLELEPVGKLLHAYERGKSSKVNANLTVDFERVEQCLDILENTTAFCPENQLNIVENEEELFPKLLEFLLYCQLEGCNTNSKNPSIAMECLLACLRVLINLTNDNQPCCRHVGQPPGLSILMRLATIGQLPPETPSRKSQQRSTKIDEDNLENMENVEALKFDVLLLSVGLLTNLVEMDSRNQDEFRKVEQNPNCLGMRTCLRICTCHSRKSAVSCLVSLYNYQIEKGGNQTDSNIVAAYMAILIGLLIKDNKPNQELILECLPGNSVQSLIDLLQDFVQFNELVSGEASAAGNLGEQRHLSSLSSNLLDMDMSMLLDGEDDSGTLNKSQQYSQGRTIADSFLEIVEILKALERKRSGEEKV